LSTGISSWWRRVVVALDPPVGERRDEEVDEAVSSVGALGLFDQVLEVEGLEESVWQHVFDCVEGVRQYPVKLISRAKRPDTPVFTTGRLAGSLGRISSAGSPAKAGNEV
jgi:hypothetical protein